MTGTNRHIAQQTMATVYKILSPDLTECYVGSTTQKVERRWQSHTDAMNCMSKLLFDTYGVENCHFIILEVCSIEERRIKEQWWLDHSVGAVNQRRAYRSDDERIEEANTRASIYYDEHREEKLAYQKKYVDANREAIALQRKAKYQENHDTIRQKANKWRAENREMVLARRKAYYEANRERILAQNRGYKKAKSPAEPSAAQ